MKTKIIKISSRNPNKKIITEASTIIKSGNLVAFPTETVYGLGANALDEKAVRKIFTAKGRPTDNPLIIHIADYKDLNKLAHALPHYAKKLINKFWPGPLTLIVRKKSIVPDIVTAKSPTVAIRMPNHKVTLALIKEAGVPIAAPSANKAGRPSGTSAEDVLDDFKNKIELILDAGQTHFGLESTVLDVSKSTPVILRPGAISKEALESVLKITLDNESNSKGKVRSPGMKYRHYAPKAKVILIPKNKTINIWQEEERLIQDFHHKGKTIGILATLPKNTKRPKADAVCFTGSTLARVGKNLFHCFRELDKKKVDIILAESVPEHDIGLAIMNRLRKASAKN